MIKKLTSGSVWRNLSDESANCIYFKNIDDTAAAAARKDDCNSKQFVSEKKVQKCILPVLTDRSLLRKVSQAIQHGLENNGFCDFQARWAFIATWHNVSASSGSSEVQTTFS